MPIYEFRCQNCGEVAEFRMKFSDPMPSVCPACAKGPLQKLISQTSFVLKGGGWYTDAYSKPATTASTSSDSSGTSASESKSTDSAKKESTPSSTTPAKAATGGKSS